MPSNFKEPSLSFLHILHLYLQSQSFPKNIKNMKFNTNLWPYIKRTFQILCEKWWEYSVILRLTTNFVFDV